MEKCLHSVDYKVTSARRRQMSISSCWVVIFALFSSFLFGQAAPVSVSIEPDHPVIEHRDGE